MKTSPPTPGRQATVAALATASVIADWLMRLTDLAADDLAGLLRHNNSAINSRLFPAEPAGTGNNKRPRGLDALLGHLLVKIIPVMFQLSSTKIPEYESQK